MKYKIVLSVIDRAVFIRDMFFARNKIFQNKVVVTTSKKNRYKVIVESNDYMCVEDVLICDLGLSVQEAKEIIQNESPVCACRSSHRIDR
jgi:hypothetical protein